MGAAAGEETEHGGKAMGGKPEEEDRQQQQQLDSVGEGRRRSLYRSGAACSVAGEGRRDG